MAITIGSETNIYTGLNIPDASLSAVVANNDIIGCFFQDVDTIPSERAYILFNRQTLTSGTKSQVNTGGNSLSIEAAQIVDDSVLTTYNKSDNDGWGRIITNSGLVPAQQPEAEFLDAGEPRDLLMAKHTTLPVGLLVYRDDDDAIQTKVTKFTVASGNVSFDGAVDITDNPTVPTLALAHWTGNKYAYSAFVASFNLRILDTTTGVTEHSRQIEGSHPAVNWAKLCRIDDTRMLCMWFSDNLLGGNGNFYAAVATLSGTATITWGTPLLLFDGTGTSQSGATILKRSGDNYVVGYNSGGAQTTFESLLVTSTTVTKVGDAASISNVGGAHLLGFLEDDAALVYTNGVSIKYRPMTGLPALSSGLARFYHGLGSLAEKFTLPFAGVQPGAMTLDKSLGTVVMGQNAASTVPIVYSLYPYVTGVATATGMPTGTSISSLKWV